MTQPAENDSGTTYQFGEERDGWIDLEVSSRKGAFLYRVPCEPIDLDSDTRPLPPAEPAS